jgi:hypothetical protein
MVGTLTFVDDNKPIPRNEIRDDVLNIHFSISRFNDIINILRYEKPLQLYLSTTDWHGTLGTETEPTGEQER